MIDVQSRNQISAPCTALNPLAPTFEHPTHNVDAMNCHKFTPAELTTALGKGELNNAVACNKPAEIPVELTNSQINARKVVFELPKFYGKPKEWPHFISSFDESTKRSCVDSKTLRTLLV